MTSTPTRTPSVCSSLYSWISSIYTSALGLYEETKPISREEAASKLFKEHQKFLFLRPSEEVQEATVAKVKSLLSTFPKDPFHQEEIPKIVSLLDHFIETATPLLSDMAELRASSPVEDVFQKLAERRCEALAYRVHLTSLDVFGKLPEQKYPEKFGKLYTKIVLYKERVLPKYLLGKETPHIIQLTTSEGSFIIKRNSRGEKDTLLREAEIMSRAYSEHIISPPIGCALLHNKLDLLPTLGVESSETSDSYILMEYAEGGSLAEPSSPLSIPQKLTCLFDAVQGLAALHDAGLVHGDFKPSNIFIKEEKGVLADLEMVGKKRAVGLTKYFSPPRSSVSFPHDIWAIGASLFSILFPEDDFEETFQTLKSGDEKTWTNYLTNRVILNNDELKSSGINPTLLSEFLVKLLQQHERKRPSIHEVLSYPFFASFKRAEAFETEEKSSSSSAFKNRSRSSSTKKSRAH